MSDRTPPHDLDAEVSILGAVMLRNDCLPLVQSRGVDSTVFYHPAHGMIFGAMEGLYDAHQPIDVLTVPDWMRKNGKNLAGVEATLAECAARVPTAENVGYYARIVVSKAALRRFIEAASTGIGKAFGQHDPAGVESFLEEQTSALMRTVAQRSRILEPRHLVEAIKARIKGDELTGAPLPTGLRRLDSAIGGGLRRRRLTVIGGRTSHGKTTAAQVMIAHLAARGIPVGVFSLEEEGPDYAEAMNERAARRTFGEERWASLSERHKLDALEINANGWSQLPVYICEERRLSMKEIARKAREMKARFGVQAIVVDYLGLIRRPGRRSEHEEIEDNIAEFNALAQQIDCAPILLAQVNREAEKQAGRDPRPKIYQLQGAGAIEQCAWLVLLVYRACVQDPKADGNLVEIIVGKNKRGPIGTTRHLWVPTVPDIRDLPDGYQPSHWMDEEEAA